MPIDQYLEESSTLVNNALTANDRIRFRNINAVHPKSPREIMTGSSGV
jgi:hypothetical protein